MTDSKRILVIDDERRMANSVCQLLRREGHEAVPAFSGGEGLARLDEEPFDLVITDLRMPDVDGLEVLRQMRERHPRTLAIVMTGHASTESAIEAIHHAAFDYIPKPFEFDHLLEIVRRALQRIETERLRQDMISMISHDIKVPLTSIIGYTSLMYDHRRKVWHSKSEDFLNIIASNAQKILALLDNYLTTCKIDAGRFVLQRRPTQVADLLTEIDSVMAPDAGKRRIRFDVDCPRDLPAIPADENLLFRALGNLVSNALKYSPPGSVIRIQARITPGAESPLGAESVTCSVENPGQGIAPEEIPHVFERYRRTASSVGIEGTGIGLFVVKSVVEAHGGAVQVESEPNVRTRFTVHLPVVSAAE